MMAALINRAGGWLTKKPNFLTEEAARSMKARGLSKALTTCGLPSPGQVAEARTYLAIKAKHKVCEVKCSTNT
jgi:hypothetical protein